MAKEPVKIFIVEDERRIARFLQMELEHEGFVTATEENGHRAYERILQEQYDLVLLDVMLPEMDGWEICRSVRKLSDVPIIMLTARDSDFDYARGISLGSDDYLTKPFSPTALVMRVKAIFRRIEYEKQHQEENHGEKPLICGQVQVDKSAKKVTFTEKEHQTEISLTPNEYDLLVFLMERAGQAVSREELLGSIWGYETETESRATDDTVRRLRKKLEMTDLIIDAVWGFGFRLHTEE